MASYNGTIEERFEWVQMILQPFKQALTGTKFEFIGVLSKDKRFFKDSSTLLDQIDKLLQIFARCRAYKFYIVSLYRIFTRILQQMLSLQFFNSMQSFVAQRLKSNLILGILRICPLKQLETGSIALMPMDKTNAF